MTSFKLIVFSAILVSIAGRQLYAPVINPTLINQVMAVLTGMLGIFVFVYRKRLIEADKGDNKNG